MWCGKLKERFHAEDLAIGGRIILKRFSKAWTRQIGSGQGPMADRCEPDRLVQDRGQCCTVVNTVTKLWVPQIVGNFLTSWTTVMLSRSTSRHAASWFVRFSIHAESLQFNSKVRVKTAGGWVTDFETWLFMFHTSSTAVFCHTNYHADTGLTPQRDEVCTNKRGLYDKASCISVNFCPVGFVSVIQCPLETDRRTHFRNI